MGLGIWGRGDIGRGYGAGDMGLGGYRVGDMGLGMGMVSRYGAKEA